MQKQLTFQYNDKEYVLEFTRATVQQMERQGFVAQDIDTKPMTILPALFAGAFLAHHRYEKAEVVDAIYKCMEDKTQLIEKLAEMYNEPITSLLEEPDEGKKIVWTPNW